jgi:alpha-L-rhamnosidase
VKGAFVVACLWLSVAARSAAAQTPGPDAPSGLMVELLAHPERAMIESARPSFGWIVEDERANARQSAYQIRIARSLASLAQGVGDVWDSAPVRSNRSVAVRYGGRALESNSTYFWTVRTWDAAGHAGPYAAPQRFRTRAIAAGHATPRYPLVEQLAPPRRDTRSSEGHRLFDFEQDAFGTLQLTATSEIAGDSLVVHLGERIAAPDHVDRQPGGTVRYRRIVLPLRAGTSTYRLPIPADARNTGPLAIKMPPEIGEVMPFRYAEIEDRDGRLRVEGVRQIRVTYPFDDDASYFVSSDSVLNTVWALSKYSIRATSFAGVYVDGDRERIPYEADAYIDQLGHYAVDREYTLARYSHEYLIAHPTWPTEWILHSVLMAWADYEATGDTVSLSAHYDDLKSKTLRALARADGLITTQGGTVTPEVLRAIHYDGAMGALRDIVDWPQAERDGHEMRPVNTVVNAFHYAALVRMRDIAAALGRTRDADELRTTADRVRRAINTTLFDASRGVYVDGEGSAHSSSHAQLFPLAFGLVPSERVPTVAALLKQRGMAVSVYAAQFLLEALYRAGEGEQALRLLTSTGKRGWAHMVYDVGSTITLEAWDAEFKPNLDWNHAWGAAPANIIPRWLMGVRPLSPGYERILVQPQPGTLGYAEARVPTIRGPVHVRFESSAELFRLDVRIPANTSARVALPRGAKGRTTVRMDGHVVPAKADGAFMVVDDVGAGRHVLQIE